MKKGYYKQSDDAYRIIFRRVCEGFHLEEADFAEFKKRAIPKLPKKDQKHLETYFGINGGVNHEDKAFRMRSAGKKLDRAEIEMERKANNIIESMRSLDYLVLFHRKIQELVQEISSKTSGEEDPIEATKWALLYATVVLNGPHIFYDHKWEVQSEKKISDETKARFSIGLLMEYVYQGIFKEFPDGDIIIPLIKLWSENLDVCDRVTILNFFGIKKPQYLEEFEGEKIQTYADIRRFKERVFSNGRWVTDGFLFLKTNHLEEELLNQIRNVFVSIRSGAKINIEEPEKFPFGTGERDIMLYSVDVGEDSLEFPSIEEIMLCYPLWMEYVMP